MKVLRAAAETAAAADEAIGIGRRNVLRAYELLVARQHV